MAKSKHLSLDDLISKGSKAFRLLNPSPTGKVSPRKTTTYEWNGPDLVDAAPPDASPQPINPDGTVGQPCPTCGRPEGPIGKPRVTITLYRVQLLDVESKYASVKYLLDGLRYSDLISDDREKDIQLFVNQVRVDAYRKEGTAIKIQYP